MSFPRFKYLSSLIFALLLTSLYSQPEPQYFTPLRVNTLTEKWRWRNLDALKPFSLESGTEGMDGKLYFASNKGIVSYDGYHCEEFPFPSKFKKSTPIQIFASKNGLIYLITNTELLSFQNGNWETIREYPDLAISRTTIKRITRNAYGLELVALPDGVYQIKGFEMVPIPQIHESIREFDFDYLNRLWIVGRREDEGKIVCYQFERTQLQSPLQRTFHTVENESMEYPRLIASTTSDEIWIIDWRQDSRARLFDEDSKTWQQIDLKNISGNNQHMAGAITHNAMLLIFSKMELILKQGNDWHTLKHPEYEIPINNPFIVQRLNGNIIIGGQGEEIHEIDLSSNRFESYQNLHFQCDNSNGSRWFISARGAIVENDPTTTSWIRHSKGVINSPLVIVSSKDDTIWAAGSHNGVAAVCYFDGKNWTRNSHPELGSLISHLSAIELSDGRIVFGAGTVAPMPDSGGAIVYQKNEKRYDFSYHGPPVFTSRPVSFAEISPGTLLMAGRELHQTQTTFDTSTTFLDTFKNKPWIDHIIADGKGTAWTGLWDEGLFKYNKNAGWERIAASDSIAGNRVVYLLNDQVQENGLWVATSNGISRFDGQHWHARTMPENIRLYRESGTLKQSKDGSIWVNSATRNWYFRTNNWSYLNDFKTIRFKLDHEAPKVSIVSCDNKLVAPANVHVEWLGADKWSSTPTSQLRYSFRQDGGEWTTFQKRTDVILLDTKAGNHTLEVKAMDLDGNISEQTTIAHFSVLLPVWQRAWFISLIALGSVLIIVLIYLLVRQRIRHIVRMDEFKLQFFTNISHELRTPLTVIAGPIESLLDKPTEQWTRRPLELAHKNVKKTLQLIDQLLDFRKAETGNVKLNLAHTDIVASVSEAIELIQPLATEQSQLLEFECNLDQCPAWFDSEKLERIVNNLISNAAKYTQQHGKIVVKMKLTEFAETINVELIVEDNGSGIPKAKIDSIFEVFYRAGNVPTSKVRGSGLGLAYTKKLVEAFSGSITVESPITNVNGKEQGTRFTLHLPLKKYLKSRELHEQSAIDEIEETENSDSQPLPSENKPSLLIVEDDSDIREFLEIELKENYYITTATNGELGLKIAREELPDLILTDVMMPKLSGKQLCHELKSNPLTCHIPIIMLTALKSEEHELEGLDAGADDYLSKPVSIQILEKRIRNHLSTYQKLHEHFKNLGLEDRTSPQLVATNPLDERFLTQAFEIVDLELESDQFDVDQLAHKMGMSRATLYRKLKAITGESPGNLIRSLRMQRAAKLLASGNCNVTEVTYSVGFSDPSAFGVSFKKHFNCSPSDYAKSPTSKTAKP